MNTRPKVVITDAQLDELLTYHDDMADTPGVSAPLTGHYRRIWLALRELKERRAADKLG